jgi:hypothetical protein
MVINVLQHILAVGVGLGTCLGMEIPSVSDLPPKEVNKVLPNGDVESVPNPAYTKAIQELGEQMVTFLPQLRLRMGVATDAAEGLNVVYENLRRQRNLNFINEVIKSSN